MQVLAIDPGRDKCGVVLALLSDLGDLQVLERAIWPRAEFMARLGDLLQLHRIETFALGDATTSRELLVELEQRHPEIPVHMVDERNSTLEARPLYWRENPPRGLSRLIPLSLQMPPRAIDDFAAQVLAMRFAQIKRDGTKQ